MAKNPKAADRASIPVSGSEGAPAASAAVGAPALAEAEIRALEDEALAQAQAAARAPALAGSVQLRAPADVSGASAGGVEYHVDDKGMIAVDPEHVPALLEHGFQRAE